MADKPKNERDTTQTLKTRQGGSVVVDPDKSTTAPDTSKGNNAAKPKGNDHGAS